MRAIRKHSWLVFAGLTQKTAQGEALWETWYSGDETFSSNPSPLGVRKIQRPFTEPRQLMPLDGRPPGVGASLLSFTLFNEETRCHIRCNGYNLQDYLTKLNRAYPDGTPTPDRHILDFPRTSMSLKTVWWIIKKCGLTAMPVWDAEKNHQLPNGNPFDTWARVVAVDPSRAKIPAGERADVDLLGTMHRGAGVVPLASLYSFAITNNEIAAVQNSSAPNASTAQIGDYAALVAMHYTTKEIPDWVWATFWWHDLPDKGRFGQDRSAKVAGVWRNYRMYTTLSMETPKALEDGGPNICFNPWLEAPLKQGLVSNCMACHQNATWPALPDSRRVVRGPICPGDSSFRYRMKLDFLWSIAIESQ